MADARQARVRRRRRNRIVVGVAIGVVVCLAGGGAAWAALRPHAPSFRLASAVKADVTQTASLAGTVASATRADRAFQVSGTVSSVDVQVGQSVTAGQTLAALDTSVLDDAVTRAQQAVTTAQQTLDDDLASQTSVAGDETATTADDTAGALAMGTFTASSLLADSPSGSGAQAVQDALAAVQAAQSTLTSDLNALTGYQTQLQSDMTASGQACQQFLTADPGQLAAELTTVQGWLTACQHTVSDDLAGATAAKTAIDGTDVPALNAAIQQLQLAVTQLTTSTPTPTPSSTPQPTQSSSPAPSQSSPPQPSQGTGGNGGGQGTGQGQPSGGAQGGGRSAGTGAGSGSGSGSGAGGAGRSGGTAATPASAEQIVADQASLASAQANLAVAQQSLSLATLTSPISGTVAAVGVSAGSSVTAKSTSQTITIIGGDGWVVDAAVAATAVGPLKVGQTASVNVSGAATALTGKVAAIGFLNTATDSSTPAYDVTVSLDGPGSELLNGASARLAIGVDRANGVLTVPSSAVHLGAGDSYTVDVLADGREQSRAVKVGAIGADRTEITAGLSVGDRVIVADLSSTVSSDSTQGTSFGRFARPGAGAGTSVLGGAGGFSGFGGRGAGTGAGLTGAP